MSSRDDERREPLRMLADAAEALQDNFARMALRPMRRAGDVAIAPPDGVPPVPRLLVLALSAVLAAAASTPSRAGSEVARRGAASAPASAEQTDRFIVRLRNPSGDPKARLAGLGGRFGERLEHLRAMSGGAHVVRLTRRMMRAEARETARLLQTDPEILSIEPDLVLQPMATPNDPYFAQQWHYHEPAGGINLPAAWDVTTGSNGITVAVIDTGVVAHADLAGRLVGGYDFIGDSAIANDGDGRDGNAADPGDYGCNGEASSWHGTHVAGTIGAASNNGSGVAGVDWQARILPVRVLGRCGGYTSDIVDGLRWAAGMAVPGVPANPFPARVANLSFGGQGGCSWAMQTAIDDVTARGTVVVVAGGNSNADAANTEPANCNGVVAVGATTRSGGRAGYSNYGSRLTVSAPGGGAGGGVLSTYNSGATTPAGDAYAWFQGTSMATPHVSGVVSLILSVNPSLSPAQVSQQLRQTARAFPTGTGADCNPALCGAGIVDAGAAVRGLASSPPVAGWTKIADEGQGFAVDGTQTVRYGSGSYWITRTVSGGGECSNAWFGTDPIVGVVKQCEVSGSAAPVAGWSQIASEGQTFSVGGTQVVRYGSGSAWITLAVTNGGACTNEFFGGDPLVGVVKHCDVSTNGSVAWSVVAFENQPFSVSGTQTVRYGSGTSWISRSVSGGGLCSNEFFGNDPLYGVVKRCEVASSAASAVLSATR
jgi:serine protease